VGCSQNPLTTRFAALLGEYPRLGQLVPTADQRSLSGRAQLAGATGSEAIAKGHTLLTLGIPIDLYLRWRRQRDRAPAEADLIELPVRPLEVASAGERWHEPTLKQAAAHDDERRPWSLLSRCLGFVGGRPRVDGP
jgi:hypothetical protein